MRLFFIFVWAIRMTPCFFSVWAIRLTPYVFCSQVTNLCVVASDAARVDALTRAAAVFERVARTEEDEDDDEAASGVQSGFIDQVACSSSNREPGQRRSRRREVLTSVSTFTRRTSGARLRDRRPLQTRSPNPATTRGRPRPRGRGEVKPPSVKSVKSKSANGDPSHSTSPADAVREQILAPLRKALGSLDPRVSSVIGPRGRGGGAGVPREAPRRGPSRGSRQAGEWRGWSWTWRRPSPPGSRRLRSRR